MDKAVIYGLVLIAVGIACALLPLAYKKCRINLPMVGAVVFGFGFSTLGFYGIYKLIVKILGVLNV